jgi:aspartyl-tRNA(Asn)/glutamyl-tRNA(Gln) amidotransferase subunit A
MDYTSLTITQTADLLQRGEATSVAITQAYLDRIEQLNPSLNAYVTVFTDTALAEAEASDARRAAGASLGMLDGIPLALKDNLSTKGQRTTASSNILKDYKPLYDATAVKKLREAGAVILGKTNMDEFAMGGSTETSAFGPSKNPWDTSRVPGGSSGGSAVAVAANLCAGAIGSDTGGSIRQPAGLCGIVGMKPTYGSVSRYGLLAMASSLDQIGPMTKSVEDARLLYEALVGHDQYDATTLPNDARTPVKEKTFSNGLQGLRVGVPKEYFGEGMEAEVEQHVRAAIKQLADLGAEIIEVSLPTTPLALAAYYIICPVEVASNMSRYDGIRYGESLEREAGEHGLLQVYEQTRSQYLGDEVKRRIMLGTYTSSAGYYDAYYNKAMKVRALIKHEFEAVFTSVDVLATPVSPTVAFKLGEHTADPLAMYLADVNTVPVNPAGVPAISVPCGFVEREGKQLPVGLQLIGDHLADQLIFDVAAAYEQVAGVQGKQPTA